MYTRVFERTSYNRFAGKDFYEIININDYGYEWIENGKTVSTGLVENLEDTIQSLLDEGFTEVL